MELDNNSIISVLNQLFREERYELVDWNLKGFSKLVGYHGSHFILVVNVKVGGIEKMLSFFVKSAVQNKEMFDKYFCKIRCFEKEHYMLVRVIDDLQSYVDEKFTSWCYLSDLNKCCVLEDLTKLGYKEVDKNKAISWDHVKTVTEKLAVMHASSIILEEKSKTSLADRYPEILFETFFNDENSDSGLAFRATYNVFNHFLHERINEIPENMREPFRIWLQSTLMNITKSVNNKYRKVICHGDPWYMNYMYKYNEQGDVEDALMVDFQVSRLAPSALELQQFLCLTYTNDLREKHALDLLQVYYNRLSQILLKSGLDASQILPMNILQESFDYYLSFGLCSKVMYTVTVHLPQEYISKLDSTEKVIKLMTEGDIELCTSAYDNDRRYREICKDSILGAYKQFMKINFKKC